MSDPRAPQDGTPDEPDTTADTYEPPADALTMTLDLPLLGEEEAWAEEHGGGTWSFATPSEDEDAAPGSEAGPAAEGEPSDEDTLADDDVWAPVPVYDPEPTTFSLPVLGGSPEAVVLDEPLAAERDEAALSLTPRRARIAMMVLAFGAFAAGVNEGAVVALTPAIAEGLGVSVATVGLLATAFALTVVAAAVPLALATKRVSRRVALTAAFAVWTVGVGVAAAAPSIEVLAVGRVLSAGAHALFWAMVAPTAASLFAPHLRARSVTGIMLGSAAAGVLGTPVVTVMGAAIGWRLPFFALVATGVVVTVALALSLPASRGSTGGPAVLGDLPNRNAFIRVLAVAFLVSVSMSTTWTYVVPYYTGVSSLPSGMVPVLFAIGGLLAVGTTLAIGPFLARHAVRTVAVGSAILALAWVVLALAQPWSAIAAQVLLSSGWAVLVAALLNWAMRHAPVRTDLAGGVYTSTANAGSALGPIVGAWVVATFSTAVLPWFSLVLTAAAGVVVATVDRRTLVMLSVPRHIRMARVSMYEVQQRRREWRLRQRELSDADRQEAAAHRHEAEERWRQAASTSSVPLDRALYMR
ncbi:MFS transporter [Demequina sp. NBRC 110055]|uniref:MFS transporter n=1 Tax=Demequina sp. NBRC 110055 TaxID=1570344 RepID=UPI000A03F448|nr:MFS transporter [Demequina sp. NBRC 110055]